MSYYVTELDEKGHPRRANLTIYLDIGGDASDSKSLQAAASAMRFLDPNTGEIMEIPPC